MFYLVNPGGLVAPPCPPNPGGLVFPPPPGTPKEGGAVGLPNPGGLPGVGLGRMGGLGGRGIGLTLNGGL